jgi:hypothetical protein
MGTGLRMAFIPHRTNSSARLYPAFYTNPGYKTSEKSIKKL